MPYVERDENEAIKGLYANLQPGYAEEFLADDDAEVLAFKHPEPLPHYPSAPAVVAAAYDINIENGSVTGISAGAKISAGFSLDTGLYMLFFDDEQPDTDFFTRVWDNDAKLRCVDKDQYSITVAATDANGDPIDPETFCVEIIRVL